MNIFVVIESGGQYSDYWEHNRAAFVDNDEARAFVSEKERIAVINKANAEKLRKFYEEYSVPKPEHQSRHEIPSWGAGMPERQITPEMREERNRLRALNNKIDNFNNQNHTKYWDNFQEALNKYAASCGINVSDTKGDLNTKWRIQEMDLIGRAR